MASKVTGQFTEAGASGFIDVVPGDYITVDVSGTYAGLKVVLERTKNGGIAFNTIAEYAADKSITFQANDITEPHYYRLRAEVTDPDKTDDEINYTLSVPVVTIGDLLALDAVAVADLPPATVAGVIVYCLDGDDGAPCLAVSDGADWLRVSLGAAVDTEV